ncbi:MAG: FKBP-type peptidyl-prolyl cis-trans isomerase [Desulfovermiculus sp.]|nr:FKBP-type peptidyl-prolyl cis-trans isomerase [Desulfovermiculus sp.]
MQPKKILTACFVCLGLTALACPAFSEQTPPETPPEHSTQEKSSYALGMDFGSQLLAKDLDLDIDMLLQGVQDVLQEKETLLSQEEKREALKSLQQELARAEQEKLQEQAKANLEKGRKFREEYQAQEGVKSTESGILYKELTTGEGETPGPNDRVTVHYQGRLVDGTVFDSSHKRKKPATFPLDQVIPGWTEILQLMPVGSTWEVVIPPELAYGKRTAGPVIGPNSTLIFELELLEISSPE